MAATAEPLFVADKDTLKASLRLGGLIESDAADDILNDSMLKARMLIIRVLGDKVVAKLRTLTAVDAPLSRYEVLRVTADQLEVVLVKRYLIPDLPTAFMDDSGSMLDTYNQEAPFRLTDSVQRKMWVEECKAQANDLAGQILAEMRTDKDADAVGSSTQINGVGAVLLSPSDEAPLLDSREGHLTSAARDSLYLSSYTRHRLWHRR